MKLVERVSEILKSEVVFGMIYAIEGNSVFVGVSPQVRSGDIIEGIIELGYFKGEFDIIIKKEDIRMMGKKVKEKVTLKTGVYTGRISLNDISSGELSVPDVVIRKGNVSIKILNGKGGGFFVIKSKNPKKIIPFLISAGEMADQDSERVDYNEFKKYLK